jgi:hypothetical protein
MFTTLSVISLDQGKIWKDPCPLPREDTATGPQETPELIESRWDLAVLRALVARLLGSNGRAGRV